MSHKHTPICAVCGEHLQDINSVNEEMRTRNSTIESMTKVMLTKDLHIRKIEAELARMHRAVDMN